MTDVDKKDRFILIFLLVFALHAVLLKSNAQWSFTLLLAIQSLTSKWVGWESHFLSWLDRIGCVRRCDGAENITWINLDQQIWDAEEIYLLISFEICRSGEVSYLRWLSFDTNVSRKIEQKTAFSTFILPAYILERRHILLVLSFIIFGQRLQPQKLNVGPPTLISLRANVLLLLLIIRKAKSKSKFITFLLLLSSFISREIFFHLMWNEKLWV